jgi:hypothetical protein
MKASILFATGLVLAAGALVGSGSAQAGEGGAAGGVGIKFTYVTGNNTPFIRNLSSSIAVGKNGAAATARTDTSAYTSAAGNSGALTMTDANTTALGYTLTPETTTGTTFVNAANSLSSSATDKGEISPAGVVLP